MRNSCPKTLRVLYEVHMGTIRTVSSPHMWLPQYDDACEKRDLKRVQKQQKAGTYLLQSVGSMNQRRSLVNWFLPQVDEVNEDEGQSVRYVTHRIR